MTICALGFGLLAISDLTKPFSQSHDLQAGLVFFGTKLTGTTDLIIAPLFAVFLEPRTRRPALEDCGFGSLEA